MSQLSTARLQEHPPMDGLFKDDRPRRIDQFIDYFGDGAGAAHGDPCGESLFDDLGSDDE